MSTAQVLVTLLICPLCSRPLDCARSVPCGNSLCDDCWNAAPLEGEMRQCPFGCPKGRHWKGTAHDVVLAKIWEVMRRHARLNDGSKHFSEGLAEETGFRELLQTGLAGKLSATAIDHTSYARDDDNHLEVPTTPANTIPSDTASVPATLLPDVLSELDCQICYSALFDPLTTPCGHTFCRTCLLRSIDHSSACPTCRAPMPPPFANTFHAPRSAVLTALFQNFWPLLWEERKRSIEEDSTSAEDIFGTMDSSRLGPGITIPIFVCTLSFPYMPTFLYIFEPRYKLMIRRCMETDQRFGICLPKPAGGGPLPGEDADCPTSQYGTVLRIYNVQYLDDGRSLVETHGEDRFRLERWGVRDGYMIGHVELLPDDGTDGDSEDTVESSLMDGEALGVPMASEDDDRSIEDLLKEAAKFIADIRDGSAPWLLQHVELTHGEVPNDPTVFAFWVASLIPVDEEEKYLLLKARGIRTRLRIVLHWVRKLQTQWWFNGGCTMM